LHTPNIVDPVLRRYRQPVITRAQAYEKMNNVIIDDRRIRCDFSQSVMKEWKQCVAPPQIHQSYCLFEYRVFATGTVCSCAKRRLKRDKSAREALTSVVVCSSKEPWAKGQSTRCWSVMNLGLRLEEQEAAGLLLERGAGTGLAEIEMKAEATTEEHQEGGGTSIESVEGRAAAAGTETGGGIRIAIGADAFVFCQ
jgi:hypothetical protein